MVSAELRHSDDTDLRRLALDLRRDDPEALFILLAQAALDGDEDRFTVVASSACDISEPGFRVMLENSHAEQSWRFLYRQSAMPDALFSAFYELVQGVARRTATPGADEARAAILKACQQHGLPEAKIRKLLVVPQNQ